jgi:hypothetical protein
MAYITPFLKGFLEDNQNAVGIQAAIPTASNYGGAPYRRGGIAGSNRFQEYWRGQAGNVYNQYLSTFARNPSSELTSFLDEYDWLKGFQDRSPSARGESPSRYAPRVRFSA